MSKWKFKCLKAKNYHHMCQVAADLISQKVRLNNKMVLGLATGGTPEGIYRLLIRDHQQNGTSYRHVTTYNLDEYVGLSGDRPNSYRYYMNERLFKHIDIPYAQTHIPNGTAQDLAQECQRYEDSLDSIGGVDLQLLGIGLNGHIGFNEPGTSFYAHTHVVQLSTSTRKANMRYFPSLEEVPTQAITMGIASIMKSKEILLVASGQKKAEILKRLFDASVSEQLPASVLKHHPNVTLLADEEAWSLVFSNYFHLETIRL